MNIPKFHLRLLALAAIALAGPMMTFAQTDEIQVYDAAIEEKGKFNLMLHDNFTPDGLKTPAFPGAIISNHSWNGVAEWAYGVAPWFEAGLYMPLYTVYSTGRGGSINGFKLRALFVKPEADKQKFFYGINFEFSVNAKYWNEKRVSSEVRPIIGRHFRIIDVIVNPILDTEYDGFKNLDFAPSERVAYKFSDDFKLAAEEYDDYGPLHQFLPAGEQYHQLWAVVDRNTKKVNIETGIGFGLNSATDKVTLKLMLSRDLN